MKTASNFPLLITTPAEQEASVPLATQYGFRVVDFAPQDSPYLIMTSQGLALQVPDPKGKAICADFQELWKANRRVNKRDPLMKATALAKRKSFIIDATAGLGRDAFRMACRAERVLAFERHPAVAAMVMDAWQRVAGRQEVENAVGDRLQFQYGDAIEMLNAMSASVSPDVVYMDVMFPAKRGKTALPGREMQVLHQVIGADVDSEELLMAARRVVKDRVVVKRHRYAPVLAGELLHQVRGPKMRYDIYLPHSR